MFSLDDKDVNSFEVKPPASNKSRSLTTETLQSDTSNLSSNLPISNSTSSNNGQINVYY